jgi:hypothetical protein
MEKGFFVEDKEIGLSIEDGDSGCFSLWYCQTPYAFCFMRFYSVERVKNQSFFSSPVVGPRKGF